MYVINLSPWNVIFKKIPVCCYINGLTFNSSINHPFFFKGHVREIYRLGSSDVLYCGRQFTTREQFFFPLPIRMLTSNPSLDCAPGKGQSSSSTLSDTQDCVWIEEKNKKDCRSGLYCWLTTLSVCFPPYFLSLFYLFFLFWKSRPWTSYCTTPNPITSRSPKLSCSVLSSSCNVVTGGC